MWGALICLVVLKAGPTHLADELEWRQRWLATCMGQDIAADDFDLCLHGTAARADERVAVVARLGEYLSGNRGSAGQRDEARRVLLLAATDRGLPARSRARRAVLDALVAAGVLHEPSRRLVPTATTMDRELRRLARRNRSRRVRWMDADSCQLVGEVAPGVLEVRCDEVGCRPNVFIPESAYRRSARVTIDARGWTLDASSTQEIGVDICGVL